MSYIIKSLYLAALCGVSGFLLFNLFHERQSTETLESPQLVAIERRTQPTVVAKQEIPTPTIAVRSSSQQKNQTLQREPDLIAQLEEVLQSKDETAIKVVVDKVGDCSPCLEHIAAFLDNPLQDVADKIALGRILMQSGTQANTLLLVNAILDAYLREEHDLKDGLIQALADAQTPESAVALTAVLTGDLVDLDFQQLPEELQYAIQKAIRLNPNGEVTGQMLVARYNSQPSPEIVERLQDVRHPVMISLLAKEAYESGDISRVEQLMDLLSTTNDLRNLDSLILLTENNVMPLDEANRRAYKWVNDHSGNFDHDHYAVYLSDFDASPAQRSIAAFALAASRNSESALATLEKAYNYESDTFVRIDLESAINLLLNRSDPQ